MHTLHRARMPSSASLASVGGGATPNGGVIAIGANCASGGGTGLVPESSFDSVAASPAQPYVSEFGSLPPTNPTASHHMNRMVLTHAPYMTKLESLASSATR